MIAILIVVESQVKDEASHLEINSIRFNQVWLDTKVGSLQNGLYLLR